MTVNFCKGLSSLLLLLVLAACSGHAQQQIGKLGELSRDDFMSAMRWKRFSMAAGYMEQEYRKAFMETFTALKDIHIVDVRLIDMQPLDEGRRFDTTVEMDYYLLPSVTVKTFRFEQTWQYFDGEDPARQGFLVTTPFPPFP